MDADRIKHLEMIQAVISRMTTNSFLLKGWTVTIVAAIFALAAKDANAKYALIALLPAICFWGLDAYYLHQERRFRRLYDAVRSDAPEIAAFSMNTQPVAAGLESWLATLSAGVVFFYHAPILATVGIVTYLAFR